MFDAYQVKKRCLGMMPPSVYERIYEEALKAPTTTFVEVGTRYAAATVALALGLKDSGRPGRIYTFDNFASSFHAELGMEENEHIVRRNLAFFGVEDLVEITVGPVEETSRVVPASADIGIMLLDADGALDRDVGIFYDRMVPGGTMIIDDIGDKVRVKRLKLGYYRMNQKMRLAYNLLQLLIEKKLISPGEITHATYFGKKLNGKAADLSTRDIAAVYHELAFVSIPSADFRTSARTTARLLLDRISPMLVKSIRAARNAD